MYKILIATIALNMLCCQAQKEKKQPITKEKNMEYFDIKKYEKLSKDETKSFSSSDMNYKEGNKRIRIIINYNKDEERTQVEETFIDSPYGAYKVYRKNDSLLASGTSFYNIPIGIDKEYNEIGELVKVTDNDEPYKLSVVDLAKKLKEEHNMDIMNPNNVHILDRWISYKSDSLPVYELYYKDKLNSGKLHYYVINANTGVVLFTGIGYEEGGKVNLYEEFLKDYQAKKVKAAEIYTTYKGKKYTYDEWKKYEKEWMEEYERKKNKNK